MTGTTGLFTKKIVIRSYVDNAGGLRVGAPVRLQGVDIGNVTGIRVVSDPRRKVDPVEAAKEAGAACVIGSMAYALCRMSTLWSRGWTAFCRTSRVDKGRLAR